MVNEQLRGLVHSFASGQIDYAGFRREFALQFMGARHDDAQLEELVNAIDSACADFDEGDISENDLKRELVDAATPAVYFYDSPSVSGTEGVFLKLQETVESAA